MKKIALSLTEFEKIRNNNYIYVDKTHFLHKIISKDKYYFLSRPRRFGKSLFLDTIKTFFEGKKIYLRALIYIIKTGNGKSIQ